MGLSRSLKLSSACSMTAGPDVRLIGIRYLVSDVLCQRIPTVLVRRSLLGVRWLHDPWTAQSDQVPS